MQCPSLKYTETELLNCNYKMVNAIPFDWTMGATNNWHKTTWSKCESGRTNM